MIRSVFAAVLFAGWFCSSAFAETAYQDDRSSAASVVRALYNAINRHEYARAFDYFSVPPTKTYAIYEQGFADTDHVDVMLGTVTAEGAAGKTYYMVPTAIKSSDGKGNFKYFAGCYTVVGVNGSIQEPPFRPLQIEKGALKAISKDDFATYALPKCGDAPEQEADTEPSLENAKAVFAREQAGTCDKVEDTLAGENEPSVYTLKYRAEGNDQDSEVTLYGFVCQLAAYNETSVYYTFDRYEGLHVLSFARPNVKTTHPKGDEEGAKLESMSVKGFTSTTTLVNSDFDPKTNSISAFDKWRGIGDASSAGTWVFEQGEFVLSDYEVDPTYDGEINPIAVMKSGALLKLP